jgi:hypothetical protein
MKKLGDIVINIAMLRYLYLNHNKITNIPDLLKKLNLMILLINDNPLKSDEIKHYQKNTYGGSLSKLTHKTNKQNKTTQRKKQTKKHKT